MSAAIATARSGSAPAEPASRDRPVRPPAGMLAGGAPCYAPFGEVLLEGALVVCHVCGRPLRSVPAHLRVHGWTKQEYCAA